MELSAKNCPISRGGSDPSPGSIHISADQDPFGRIFIADTSYHRIIVLHPDGRVVQLPSPSGREPGLFHFPNGLQVDAQGTLYVVDTNHHAIQIFDKDLRRRAVWRDFIDDQSGFTWPTQIAADAQGRLYVIVHDDQLQEGELVRLDAEGHRDLVYPLPAGTRPYDVVALGDTLLVSDAHNFRILVIGQQTAVVDDFGDETLQDLFRQFKKRRSVYQRIVPVIQQGLLILLGLCVVLYLLDRARLPKHRRPQLLARLVVKRPIPLRARLHFLIWNYLPVHVVGGPMLIGYLGARLWGTPAYSGYLGTIVWMAFWQAGFHLSPAQAVWFLPFIEALDKKLLRRFWGEIEPVLPPDQDVLQVATVVADNTPALLLRTSTTLLVFSLNTTGSDITRLRTLDVRSLTAAQMEPVISERWGWILGLAAPRTRVSFYIRSGKTGWSLDFLSLLAAHDMAEAINNAIPAPGGDGAEGVKELCPQCHRELAPRQHCPDCRPLFPSRRQVILLSVFCPGLGQLAQREFFKGGMYLLGFSLFSAALVDLGIVLFYRSRAVNGVNLLLLVMVALLLWAVSLLQAIQTSNKIWGRRVG